MSTRVLKKPKSNSQPIGSRSNSPAGSLDSETGQEMQSPSQVWSPKNLIWATLKWAFAIILLVLVFKSGKISTDPILVFLKTPEQAAPIVLVIWGVAICTFIRWQWILKGLGINMSAGTAIRLGMTGQFFSLVIPGVVGGDLIKGVYLARKYPNSKTRSVTSLLVDRITGLMGMLLLGAIAFCLEYSILSSKPLTKELDFLMSMGWLVTAMGVAIVFSLAMLPFMGKWIPAELPALFRKLPMQSFLFSLYSAGYDFRKNYKYLWASVGISILFHAVNLWAIYGIAGIIFGPSPWGQLDLAGFALSFVLGNCALSVPLTPLGVGVGQIAFSTLFLASGAPTKNFGGDLITNIQLIQIGLGLLGSLFFITYKNKKEMK